MVISDAVVVNRVREGESEAFGLLFERYHDRCARLAMRLLGDPDEAADAVQDAFIRAFLSLDRYQERDRFSSWLLCIVANRCRTASAAARRRADTAAEWIDMGANSGCGADLVAESDHALAQRLNEALGTLPDQTRAVLLRKYREGLSYEEISADTGIAVSALKMRVARASASLRRTLLGAGITLATLTIIFATHTRDTRRPRTATVVACDTLRAIMHDTLDAATRDSLLPPGRCGEDTQALSPERRLRGQDSPIPKQEY